MKKQNHSTSKYFPHALSLLVLASVISCADSAVQDSRTSSEEGAQSFSTNDIDLSKLPSEASSDDDFALIGGAATSAYPATAFIASKLTATTVRVCSGVFIAKNALVTAASCVNPDRTGLVSYLGNSAVTQARFSQIYNSAPKSIRAINHGNSYVGSAINENVEASRQRNLAIVIFATDLAPATMVLATAAPAINAAATMVAYGYRSASDRATTVTYQQQKGATVISRPLIANVTTLLVGSDRGVQSSVGDQGGALIVGGKLAGIISTIYGYSNGAKQVFSVDLNSALSKTLIRQAKAAGAKIP